MSKIGREGTTRTTTRITQKNDLESIKNTKKTRTMPIPVAAIAGGAQVASTAINAISQGSINKKTRQWNEAQYQKQREDALADWARTNEYNAPLQQMARLKEAGLSPHLIYGGGANSISQPVRSTDTKSWSPSAPQIDGGQIVSQYFGVQHQQNALEIQEQQIRGLKIANNIAEAGEEDKKQAAGIANQATTAKIDNFMADTNLKRLKASMQGLEFQKLEQEVEQIVTNNKYNALNQQAKLSITGFMQEQIQAITAGQLNKNKITEIEAKWRKQIDDYVGAAGPLSQSLLKILVSALLK